MKKGILLFIISLVLSQYTLFPQRAYDFVPVEKHGFQWNGGFSRLGFNTSPFQQFTQDDFFADTSLPFTLEWFNFYQYYKTFSEAIPSFGIGFEFNHINSEAIFEQPVRIGIKPVIAMRMQLIGVNTRINFAEIDNNTSGQDLFDLVQIFVGLGWGTYIGEFSGTYIPPSENLRTSFLQQFSGIYTFREFGFVVREDTFGFGAFIRTFSTQVIETEDINGAPLELDLNGIQYGINGTVRL